MLNNKGRAYSTSGGSILNTVREYGLFEDLDIHTPLNSAVMLDDGRDEDSVERMGKGHLGESMESLFISGRSRYTKAEDGEKFNPYEDNSGTVVCLRQDDFIVIGGDTRHSSDMIINSREMTKIFQIGDLFLTGTGFYADSHEVYVKMAYEIRQYEVEGSINVHSAANLLSKILYSKRFFPYYSYCVLSGFENGRPYVYSYDPVGSFESVTCICNGSGRSMIQPLLDSFVSKKNWNNAGQAQLSQEDCVRLITKAFNAAAERDVKTKDNLEVYVVRENEVERKVFPLRRD
ncbi:20S proteasome subunit beta type-1 [Encephalitozoon romaleae SJ-2008]|uniref:20S proteasome subunit beta type-1 n=1 Tax=Encephalitozoon romaleae (strain SJ-2008) TaxID=1178016 RepID=I6ZUK9_ENCRO|nr:20S proteasome subunit beta type-1 [Encephalitozoon romaleae SJ-2008]AFN83386.1 20S proteasome subunit beta type-1 [Encephalitozoon romaleae SJ-2008]